MIRTKIILLLCETIFTQTPPKVLEQYGELKRFCCVLKTSV